MAANFQWAQSHGVGPTVVDLGETGNLFNFKDIDDATVGNYSSNPITAGNNSYEVWLRGNFSGTFNQVDNGQFWMSTDFAPNTGLPIEWEGDNVTWAQSVKTDSTKAVTAMPTSDPGTANVSFAGTLGGNITSAGYSDYIVMQLQTTVSAAAGDTSLAVFTLQYDEQ